MNQKPLPIGEIKSLAADIRLIKDFAENHNFDASLINATVEVKDSRFKSRNWSMIIGAFFTILVVVTIGMLNFWEGLTPTASKFVFALGLLFAVIASLCAQKCFDNITITVIYGLGLVVVLLVGAGVFTPREAVGELQKLWQK
jgi:hypothetical protein